MFNSKSNSFRFINRNTTCIIFPMHCRFARVELYVLHVSPDRFCFIYIFVHAYNFSISGVRFYSWLNMYFPSDRYTKQSMYNTRNWPSSVGNYGMICILMKFQTIMGCVVFNLMTAPYKPDDILSIIRIRRIKYDFMWVNS